MITHDDHDLAGLLGPLDGEPGPARRLSSARSAALVASIIDAAQAAGPIAADPTAEAPAPRAGDRVAPARRGRVVLLAAAIVLVTASVAAATGAWLARRAPVAEATAPEPADGRGRAPRRAAPVVVPAPVAEDALDAAVIEIEPLPPLEPAVADPRGTGATPVPPRPPRAVESDEPAADAPLEDLLAAANQRRKARRWRDAAALYERVMREHAGADAAVVATVASAALHLERLGDAASALRRYQQALRARPDGPLAEEARWGIAAARRALGDDAAEREALRGFVAAHPQSPRIAAARRRLAELDAAAEPR